MDKKTVHTNRFQIKLVIAFLMIGLVPLIIASSIYLRILNDRITRDNEISSIENLRYLSFNIRHQMDTAERMASWLTYNQKLNHILTKDYQNLYEKQLDIIEFSSYVTEYSMNANVESNISKILILDEDGDSFQMGDSYSLIRAEEVQKAGWLETYQKQQADQLVISKDWYAKEDYVFPLSSRIYDNLTGRPIGWCLILFKNTMYSDYLTARAEAEQGERLFLINEAGQCIADRKSERLGMDLSLDPLIKEILSAGQSSGHVIGDYAGEPMILHYYRLPDTGVIEVQGTSEAAFLMERRNMTRLTVAVILLTILAICLTVFYLSSLLTKPINTISAYIKKVPENGFQGNLKLEREDEFKKIAEAINNMELEILQLMEQQRQEAERKKELEFQVLQNQINPHFLYNTLNSIKMIATLQHADTIRDMTAALGRLLQNISKGTENKIPIFEEMSLLDDYVLIQDIRYGGKIQVQYHIGDSKITQAYIIKFLLQPIVENAIFHGIEPKDGVGQIHIYLEREGEDVVISVVDDGVGMGPEQIEALLNPPAGESKKRGLNGIGVSNIQERIRMTYGDRYGLEVTSQLGAFTKVKIRIPYEKEG